MSCYTYTLNGHDPVTEVRDRVFPHLKGKFPGDRVEFTVDTLSKQAAPVGRGTLGGAAMGGVAGGYATRAIMDALGASRSAKNWGTAAGALTGAALGGLAGNTLDDPSKADEYGRPESGSGTTADLLTYGGLGALGAAAGDVAANVFGESDNPGFRVLMATIGGSLGAGGAYMLRGAEEKAFKDLGEWKPDQTLSPTERLTATLERIQKNEPQGLHSNLWSTGELLAGVGVANWAPSALWHLAKGIKHGYDNKPGVYIPEHAYRKYIGGVAGHAPEIAKALGSGAKALKAGVAEKLEAISNIRLNRKAKAMAEQLGSTPETLKKFLKVLKLARKARGR